MENDNTPFQNDDHVNADGTTNQKDDLSDNQDEKPEFSNLLLSLSLCFDTKFCKIFYADDIATEKMSLEPDPKKY